MNKFHRKCGDRVTLLNQNLTAIRNFVEFNHGLILSADALTDDVLFEVRIDRKVNVWNGSLEIGVTTLDPEFLELPATATKLRNTAWILSGNSIVKDGVTILNSYGPELDSLREGDCLAVSRSSKGELMFFINGRCLGIAAKDLPVRLFAVIDLYGQCVQVSIVHGNYPRPAMDQPFEGASSEAGACALPRSHRDTHIQMPLIFPLVSQDNLRFHPRCGILVKLSNNNKSAERARPLDDYNNGVVMTHRPLYDNEFFEIRIDKLVDKWSGSIEVGVTAHNPATIRFPSTMTNMESGTIMMSGCKVLMNGQGACMEYGNFNLDELREGDTVGMMRKGNGKLHYFINGVDQGVATDKVPHQVWGVVDLYGMTVKVTVVDPCEDVDSNMSGGEAGRAPPPALPAPAPSAPPDPSPDEPPPHPSTSSLEPVSAAGCTGLVDEEQLLFHTLRDSHVIIINDGRTAHRPNAFEIFNNGFVMTNRTLKSNELFQVRLDLVIPKWAGSIEIGVTQHSSNDIRFPFRMINATSGTWGITGEDVIRDGTIIIPQYVRNLSRLVEGDTVGVMRKDMGILHFFVNGVDQGPAAFNIPEHVFGIVDLYGRVAQATIVDSYTPLPVSSPESPVSFESNATVLPEMCFHRVHGANARVSRSRLTASRAAVYSEFNDAVLFSARPLRECDMFQIRIDKMVDCWIGSLEIGVTAIRPEELEGGGGRGALAGTATDLSWDTYILSGSAIMKDGECVRGGYPLDLDTLTVGSRVGMMWHADRSLHYYLDGMDMGKAWYVPHLNIYAVVDLYGQCTQVTILQNEERAFNYNGCNADHGALPYPRALPTPPPPYWSFSEYHGDNVSLSKDYTVARRVSPDPMGALVFSSVHLIVDELYEIQIAECRSSCAGGLRVGVTDVNVLNAIVNRNLPLCVARLPHYTAYIDGKYMKYSRPGRTAEKELQSFVPSLDWLRVGDRLALKKTADARVLLYYNSELLEDAFENVPDKVYVVMELYGTTTKIQTVSRGANVVPGNQQTIPNDKPDTEKATAAADPSAEGGEESAPGEAGEEGSPSAPPAADLPGEGGGEEPPQPSGSASPRAEAQRLRRGALPYTFHFMTGNNIRLRSSDTVALRYRGYSDAVAVASQPLHRGMAFRFRVDRVSSQWAGTVCIGALGWLPSEAPPVSALHFTGPCWLISNDVLFDRGVYTMSEVGRKLDEISKNSVLTLHFRQNSELSLEVDGVQRGVIATVPRRFANIYPAIDLYGKIVQVSILLHPHVILGGTSLDLPMITEKHEEGGDEPDSESGAEPEPEPEPSESEPEESAPAADSELLVASDELDDGDSEEPVSELLEELAGAGEGRSANEARNCAIALCLHHSLVRGEGEAERAVPRSRSTHHLDLPQHSSSSDSSPLNPLRVGERILDDDTDSSPDEPCDTNIRHNDRYPEANEPNEPNDSAGYDASASDAIDDHLENAFIDGMFLDSGNMPDLSEERSLSGDESTTTRRDDCWAEETLHYLKVLVGGGAASAGGGGRDWLFYAETSGHCEVMHLALKFWNQVVAPYADMRDLVAGGTVHCFCHSCHADADALYTGWVRIERAQAAGEARRYWHVTRGAVTSALALGDGGDGPARRSRPRNYYTHPSTEPACADTWIDEEGKPHQAALALDVDIGGEDAESDRLMGYWIYLRSHAALALDAEDVEDTAADAADELLDAVASPHGDTPDLDDDGDGDGDDQP